MAISFYQVLFWLLAGIVVIILLTTKYRVHAFFALILACFVTGLGVQLPLADVITTIKDGFGNIMKSLGLIIVLGTTLGILLEHTGSTKVMAEYILKKTGERYAAFAMSITGFIVGLPVFCDSGYIVLSGLTQPLSKRTGVPVITIATSLATGLYAVHCLIPPHPGPAMAGGALGVDFGKLILVGIIAAVPAMAVGYWWAILSVKRIGAGKKIMPVEVKEEVIVQDIAAGPSVIRAFLPVIIPVILIAAKSFFTIETAGTQKWILFFLSLGDPVIALLIGVLLAFSAKKGWNKNTVAMLLHESVEKAGSILVIIGAGGAFGAILAVTKPGEHFSTITVMGSAGILFSFLLTFILKTAQGSSTVAIITAASIVQPLMPLLGFHTPTEKLLCVLSMGAGSMAISHANDAYFWVIVKFSGLDMKSVLRVYSIATLWMALVTLLMVYILSFVLT